jgi:alginate O-acetyltransferase complex protein AlgI
MIFSSLTFVVFLTIVCALLALTNLQKIKAALPINVNELRHTMLLLASYVFYGWWNWKCCFLMLGLTVVAWYCAGAYERDGKKLWVRLGVILPLVILGIFKYFNFFIDSFCAVFGIARAGSLNILLPVGISFYTFQSLSYTIDVYRGKLKAEKSFLNVALYVAFFPQLVAGPIVKAGEYIPQLYEDRNISLKNLQAGVQIFAMGLFKKIVLADNISTFVDAVYKNPAEFHAVTVILAVAAYSIQIYCDFSGYSDMAVGCARCLGYDLPRNFNLPYISKNVTEFWKRWHISLSTWLMEYLYIPLGGNRKGRVRRYINLMLTMLIGGLWHGAAWTFVVWGGLHGLALCVHKLFLNLTAGREKKERFLVSLISVLATFCFTSLCWVFFRAGDFTTAMKIFKAMFTWQQGLIHLSSWAMLGLGCTAIATIVAYVRSKRLHTAFDGFYPQLNLNSIPGLVALFFFVGLTLGLAYTGENPFIYFQF